MKKILFAFMMLLGFVLISCGSNDLSKKSGDITFSIPTAEIGRYFEASRDAASTDGETFQFAVIAQIKGSKGYYSYQKGAADYTPGTTVVAEGSTSSTSTGSYNEFYNSMKEHVEDLEFSFKELPADQYYSLFFDILIKEPSYGDPASSDYWNHLLTGKEEEISVEPDNTRNVDLQLENVTDLEKSNFNLKVVYNKDQSQETEYIPIDSQSLLRYHFSQDEQDNFFFSHAGREWYTLSELKLVIAPECHFTNETVMRLLKNEDYSEPEGTSLEDTILAESTKGEIDLMALYSDKDAEDSSFECLIQLDFYGLSLMEYLWLEIPSEQNNFGAFYNGGEHEYKFVKDEEVSEASKDGSNRFVMTIPLEDILGSDPLEPGDSIAFPLVNLNIYKPDDYGNKIALNNLSYQFQKAGWEELNSTDLYINNVTVGFNKDNVYGDIFVLAANFIEGDEKYLQLYTDLDKEFKDVDELVSNFTIKYKVFPASDKVYVFHNSFASWSEIRVDVDTGDQMEETIKDYRKEMALDINGCFEKAGKWPATGSTITLSIGGSFSTLSESDSPVVEKETALHAELYDNIDYAGCSHGAYYHTLSNSSTSNNNSNFNNLITEEDGSLGSIIFDKITDVHPVTDHKYRLQLFKSMGDDNDGSLLIIKDFSISVAVQGGSSSPDGSIEDIGD